MSKFDENFQTARYSFHYSIVTSYLYAEKNGIVDGPYIRYIHRQKRSVIHKSSHNASL